MPVWPGKSGWTGINSDMAEVVEIGLRSFEKMDLSGMM